jgi:hypothetical protein
MTQQTINTGTYANDRSGDSLLAAFTKINANFTELYTSTVAGSSDRLTAGDKSLILDTDGNLTFPQGTVLGYSDPGGFIIDGAVDKDILIYTYDGATAHGWTFGTDGSLTLPGAFAYPNSALQKDTGTVNCAGNTSTMIYTTSSTSNQHTIKLLIQVEGTVGAAADMDTQACEMIIAKSFRADAIAASVYGVVHTSVAPLATFNANWNALTSKVEVMCTTPSANGVVVRIFATEITTSD